MIEVEFKGIFQLVVTEPFESIIAIKSSYWRGYFLNTLDGDKMRPTTRVPNKRVYAYHATKRRQAQHNARLGTMPFNIISMYFNVIQGDLAFRFLWGCIKFYSLIKMSYNKGPMNI